MGPDAFRQHFPIFQDSVHLCSCSEGALSDRVMVAMSEFMTSWRIHGAPWDAWMQEVDRARTQFADLIHAQVEDVAVVSCASEAAFQVAWAENFTQDRPTIVTTDLEFPSVAHVWLAARSRGVEVEFVPHHDGLVAAEQYAKVVTQRTALVSVPLVSYANGLRFPVTDIARQAHQNGAHVVVDAYQGAGVVPIDVRELECDYLIAGALKYLLGAPGIAFLWVRPGLERGVDPALTGWFARTNPFAFTPKVLDYADNARRFQTGTPSIPAAYAATAGLSLLNETNSEDVFRHVEGLAAALQDRVVNLGYRLYSPANPESRGPQVTVWSERSEHLSTFLKERRIFVSPRGQAIRMSLHFYNNEDDVKAVTQALSEYRG